MPWLGKGEVLGVGVQAVVAAVLGVVRVKDQLVPGRDAGINPVKTT
jgi:hypothetical protein